MTCCAPSAQQGFYASKGYSPVPARSRSLGVREADQKFIVVDQDVLEPLVDSLTPGYFLTSGAKIVVLAVLFAGLLP
jgi:hypothetical protein